MGWPHKRCRTNEELVLGPKKVLMREISSVSRPAALEFWERYGRNGLRLTPAGR
jgi:hypothetical protein